MPLKILLADDSMTAQSMGKKILAEAGYDVVAVSNGAAAIKKLAETKFDIILLDVYMPGYSGLEVCEKVKSGPASTQVPVLLTVGKMEPFKVEEGIKVRADGLIVKPFEATDLLTVVGKLAELVQAAPVAEPVAEPAAEAPPLQEFEVAPAAPEPASVELPEFDLAKAPAVPFDIFEETAASPMAAALPAAIVAPAAEQARPPAPERTMLDMREFEAAIAQVPPAAETTAEPPIEIEIAAEEPNPSVPPPAPVAAPLEPVSPPVPVVASANVAASEEQPQPAAEQPAAFTIEFSEFPVAAPGTTGAALQPAVQPGPSAIVIPSLATPEPHEIPRGEPERPWKMEFTLEPAGEPAESEFTLEPLDGDEAAAQDGIFSSAAPAIAESAPEAVPVSLSAPPAAEPVETISSQETAPEEEAAPTFEIRLEPEPEGASSEAEISEPQISVAEIELTFAAPSAAAVENEPALEVIAEESAVPSGNIIPEPTLMRPEPADVPQDAALITDIHDFSAYAPSAFRPSSEQLAAPEVLEAVESRADAVPLESAGDELPPDATVTADLPDAPAVVEVIAQQTQYPELAEESPEFAIFGPHGTQARETQSDVRLSAALDAYDQAPEPPPERSGTGTAAIQGRPEALSESSPVPIQAEPALEQAAEQVFAAAAASLGSGPAEVPPAASAPETGSVSEPAAGAMAAQVAASSPALQKLIAAIVDHVIERLKPEMLAELERRRSELVAEISKELKNH